MLLRATAGRFSFHISSIAGPEAAQGGHQQGPLFSLQITQHPAAASQLPGLRIKRGPFGIGSCWETRISEVPWLCLPVEPLPPLAFVFPKNAFASHSAQ